MTFHHSTNSDCFLPQKRISILLISSQNSKWITVHIKSKKKKIKEHPSQKCKIRSELNVVQDTHKAITGAESSGTPHIRVRVWHLSKEVAEGVARTLYFWALQATVPFFCDKTWGNKVWIDGQIKVQTVSTIVQLVENLSQLPGFLSFSPLKPTHMVRYNTGNELTPWIHPERVDHFIRRKSLGDICKTDPSQTFLM